MLDVWERDMIALYDCISPNGYNLTEGGGGCKCSEETRLKMSNVRKGRISNRKGVPCSEEHKRKISEANKGRISNRKGKHHSEESKRKMSESHKRLHKK